MCFKALNKWSCLCLCSFCSLALRFCPGRPHEIQRLLGLWHQQTSQQTSACIVVVCVSVPTEDANSPSWEDVALLTCPSHKRCRSTGPPFPFSWNPNNTERSVQPRKGTQVLKGVNALKVHAFSLRDTAGEISPNLSFFPEMFIALNSQKMPNHTNT